MNRAQHALYDAALARHARRRSDGKVMGCRPSNAELCGVEPRKEPRWSDGRPIFDTEAAATAAVAELLAAGAHPQEVYRCRRGSGHWHFRSVDAR